MPELGEYRVDCFVTVFLRCHGSLLIRFKLAVQAMAVHRRRRRNHRIFPLRPRSRPPQRPVHVRQTKACNRIRIRLSITVSSHIQSLSPTRKPILTTYQNSLIVFSLLHISTLHSALASKDITLAAVEPTLWLQAEVHYALIACSVFCLRPFMAAVSTNYGTAGDENLENDASATRSRETKGSGSGSGSNSNSRSRSLSRVRRKRAGTASRSRTDRNARPRSSSKEELRQNGVGHDWDAQGQKKTQAPSHTRNTPIRFPIRRSMFALGARPTQDPSRIDKGKDGVRGTCSTPSLAGVDAIELMPQLSRQRARQEGDGPFEAVDPERMVIRKEVQYSIQYEYDEARRRGEGSCKEGCTDAMAYV